MNANEALRKIAEALNIVEAEPKVENVEQPVEQPIEQPVEEKTEQPVEESVEQPVENVIEEQNEVVEENEEQPSEPEQPKNDERVAELERQLADLKEILKNAFTQEPEVETKVETPVQKNEPKGLTHSPEKTVKPQVKAIGNKGNDIMSRVFKYMNN